MLNSYASHAEQMSEYPIWMETMGDRIRVLRQARGLSQSQLGERLGVTVGAISQWESGATKNIKLETFLALCDELGVSGHYLVLGPTAKPEPQLPASRRR